VDKPVGGDMINSIDGRQMDIKVSGKVEEHNLLDDSLGIEVIFLGSGCNLQNL
jgi:hypothetical protein